VFPAHLTQVSEPSARLLLVEDDETVGSSLVASLAAAGHEIGWAKDLTQARVRLSGSTMDLVLLDLGLPDGDGLQVCKELRASDERTIIVVVTAQSAAADAVRALDAGADDYVTKPFRTEELLARLRAHLRRRDVSGKDEVRVGDLRLDARARSATYALAALALRPKEFDLLALLASEAGSAVRRERLMDEVWDENWTGSTKTLDVHVANLRRKLADAGDRWDRIATLRGFGYRFELDD
jgi:DNA-binding response OmpR family regulator